MKISYSLDDLKRIIQEGEIDGFQSNLKITGVASLSEATSNDLSFLGNLKYKKEVERSRAGVVLLPKDFSGKPKADQVYWRVDNPSFVLGLICHEIEKILWPIKDPGIHPLAYIEAGADVHPTAYIGPFCFVGHDSKIGEGCVLISHVHVGKAVQMGSNTYLMPHVSLMDYCQLGRQVRLHSGVVIGSDGFGYEFVDGHHKKMPQIGYVVIEDDVEIGSNTTIDRGRLGETRIGAGTKIDNLVQVGHNVKVGRGCILVAQSGISGSTIIEDYVIIGGQVGIAGHLRVGKGSKIGAQSGLNKNLDANSYVQGTPPYSHMQANRLEILKKRLPELFQRVGVLEETIKRLKH